MWQGTKGMYIENRGIIHRSVHVILQVLDMPLHSNFRKIVYENIIKKTTPYSYASSSTSQPL
jgi:hypothetical protein